jgi:hypothetical protein
MRSADYLCGPGPCTTLVDHLQNFAYRTIGPSTINPSLESRDSREQQSFKVQDISLFISVIYFTINSVFVDVQLILLSQEKCWKNVVIKSSIKNIGILWRIRICVCVCVGGGGGGGGGCGWRILPNYSYFNVKKLLELWML